jgi:hypothetical protein
MGDKKKKCSHGSLTPKQSKIQARSNHNKVQVLINIANHNLVFRKHKPLKWVLGMWGCGLSDPKSHNKKKSLRPN